MSGVFKGPEIRLLLLIVTRQTRTRHAFALCHAAPCLACFHDLYSLVSTDSFIRRDRFQVSKSCRRRRVCKGDAERKRGERRGRCFCVNCLLPTSPLCRATLLSPSSPFNVGFSGTKRERERVYKIEGEDGGRSREGRADGKTKSGNSLKLISVNLVIQSPLHFMTKLSRCVARVQQE